MRRARAPLLEPSIAWGARAADASASSGTPATSAKIPATNPRSLPRPAPQAPGRPDRPQPCVYIMHTHSLGRSGVAVKTHHGCAVDSPTDNNDLNPSSTRRRYVANAMAKSDGAKARKRWPETRKLSARAGPPILDA